MPEQQPTTHKPTPDEPIAPPECAETLPETGVIPRFRDLLPSTKVALARFSLAGLLPLATFYLLFRTWGPIAGIAGGMVVSLSALAIQAWRLRRVDPIVVVPMVVIAVQGSLAVAMGSIELYLAVPAIENAVWGTALLISVALKRPLIRVIARELDLVPAAYAHSAALDRALDRLTLAWALGAFVKAAVRLWLLQTLAIEPFLVTITIFNLTVNGGLLAASFWWPLRRARQEAGVREQIAPEDQ